MSTEFRIQNLKPIRDALVSRPADGVAPHHGDGHQPEEPAVAEAKEREGVLQELDPADPDPDQHDHHDHESLVDGVDPVEVQAAGLVPDEETVRPRESKTRS